MPPAVAAPPPTLMEPVTEVLHGIEVTDPYRWLEDQNSPRTRAWLEEQTRYTRDYLDTIPDRDRIRERVRQLFALKEVISDVWNAGDRYFFLKCNQEKEQPVIAMRSGSDGEDIVLVDPALRQAETSTAVAISAVSQDRRFLAYSVRQGGTDYASLEILDIESRRVLEDGLPEGLCTSIAFAPDSSGFYYSHRERHDLRPNYQAVFWHRFNTDGSKDREVFFAGEEPGLYLSILQSPEAGLLLYCVLRAGKRSHTSLHLSSTRPDVTPEAVTPRELLNNIEGWFVPFFIGSRLLACTDISAPNRRIVAIDLSNPEPSHWQDIVPESAQRIRQFGVADDLILVTRVDRFSTNVQVFGLDGSQHGDLALPPYGTVDLPNTANTTDRCVINYTSICTPSTVYCYLGRTRRLDPLDAANGTYRPSISIEEVSYPSKDGTQIPLFLAVRQDLVRSGPLPTFLTGYGGFGSCVTPRFTALGTFLLENGFLFAVPALRGGSELGEQWHDAGRCEHRQNSFDDFNCAAEWLLVQRYSRPGQIVIGGASNAGLLVGAAITQRPDLFRAAICLGPLLDMTRYHLFDFAAGWADEYGSPDEERDFRSLLAYSPYHRVQDGTSYPAVLMVSGDADTRCNPMHARKMAARLQSANHSRHPILLDYKPNWGHMPVQPLSVKIEALTDRLAFICRELGIEVRQGGS